MSQSVNSASGGKKETIWTKDFTMLFIASTFISMSSYLVSAILPLYCKDLGATDTTVGFIIGLFNTAALLSRPFSGPCIDAWDRRKLYIVMALIDAVSLFGHAAATGINLLMAMRLLQGVSYGTIVSLALTMASASLPAHLMGTGVAFFTLSHIIPQAIGPGIGLFLSNNFGYKYAYIASAVSVLAAALMATRVTPQAGPFRKPVFRLNTIFAFEALVPVIVIAILGFTSAAITSFMVLMVNERAIEGLSLYYTITAIALVAARPVSGKLADRFGQAKVVPVCLLIYIVNLALLAFCSSKLQLWACAVLFAAGYSSAYSLIQSLAMKLVPVERRGSAGSSCYIGMDLGIMLGSTLSGVIKQATNYTTLYLTMIIPVAAAIVLLVLWDRKKTAA